MVIGTKIKATVETIHQHCGDTKSFVLKTVDAFLFKPGQFIMVNVPFKDTFVRRAYSIACKPGGVLELCMNYLPEGKGSDYFFNMNQGESVHIDGPYGIFTLRENDHDKMFICTGTGVAPLRSMIHHLLENGATEQLTLVFGERTEQELLYQNEFRDCAKRHNNFTYVPILSRTNGKWNGEKGYVQDAMKKYIKNLESTEFYICGLKEMVDDVRNKLIELGVDRQRIFTEKFV